MKIIYTDISLSDEYSEKLSKWEKENNKSVEELLDELLADFISKLPTVDTKYLSIKQKYEKSAEFEGEGYKWMSLRNEDIEYLFKLIDKEGGKNELSISS